MADFAKAKRPGFYGGLYVNKDEVFALNESGLPDWAEPTDGAPLEKQRRESDFRKLANSAAQNNNLGVGDPVLRGDDSLPVAKPAESDERGSNPKPEPARRGRPPKVKDDGEDLV